MSKDIHFSTTLSVVSKASPTRYSVEWRIYFYRPKKKDIGKVHLLLGGHATSIFLWPSSISRQVESHIKNSVVSH
jgi:hypothetical protein